MQTPPPPEKSEKLRGFANLHYQIRFFFIFSMFTQIWLNIVFDPENAGIMGGWVLGLGVRVRMEGVLN